MLVFKAMELLIHHTQSPIVRKVLLVAHELGLDLPLKRVDWPNKEHLTSYYRTLNPNAKFPTLLDGDMAIWESNAIILHLAEKSGTLLPAGNPGRIEVMKWLFWEAAQFSQACLNLTYRFFHLAKQLPPEILERYMLDFTVYAELLDRHLETHQFIAGDALSIADYSIASNLTYIDRTRMDISHYTNLFHWLEMIKSRPAWKATEPLQEDPKI